MKPKDQYELDPGQLQLALDVLRREQKASELSRFQKICYWLFQGCGYLFAASFVVMLVAEFAGRTPGSSRVAGVAALAAGLFGFFALVLMLMNLPLILKARRRERMVAKLGLSALLSASWKSQLRQRRLVNVVTLVVASLFALMVALLMIGGIVGVVQQGTGDKKGGFFNITDVVVGMTIAALLLSIPLFAYLVRRQRDRHKFLMDMRKIEESLMRHKEAVAGAALPRVAVPAADVERIAAIEMMQIAAERADSIKSFGKRQAGRFDLLPSREFHEARSRLDPATSARIDALIQQLSDEPQPTQGRRDPESEGWLLNVPDTGWTISYAVDRDRHSVKLFGLRRADEPRTSD